MQLPHDVSTGIDVERAIDLHVKSVDRKTKVKKKEERGRILAFNFMSERARGKKEKGGSASTPLVTPLSRYTDRSLLRHRAAKGAWKTEKEEPEPLCRSLLLLSQFPPSPLRYHHKDRDGYINICRERERERCITFFFH